MARKFATMTIKVKSEAGKKRLQADLDKKHALKQAIQDKVPSEEIEKRFSIKFVKTV